MVRLCSTKLWIMPKGLRSNFSSSKWTLKKLMIRSIDYMMKRLGFCHKWRDGLEVVFYSLVLVNGSPTNEFQMSK
ncbi:hypothetical protein CR513_48881, partial [Mucuna pruriens]